MANKIRSEQIKNIIGKEVVYTKSGSRNGWVGVISKFDEGNGRVQINYDNGIEQLYYHTALKLNGDYTDDMSGYLEVGDFRKFTNITPSSNSSTGKPLPEECYLILNMQTGSVVGVEFNIADAELFAEEQAIDSKDKHKFTIFEPKTTFKQEMPKVTIKSIISGIFSK